MTKKTLTIRSIRRARNKLNPSIPGNILINATGDPVKDVLCWFSGREWSNNIISSELPREIPIAAFIGSRLDYEVLEVTEEMLTTGGGIFVAVIGGREITYKQPGIHNVNLNIDWNTVNFSESTVNMTRIKALFPNTLAPRPVAPALTRETIEEPQGIDGGIEALKILTEEEKAKQPTDKIEEPVDLEA